MLTHWTYAQVLDPDLEQGDIIQPTERMRSVLDQAHKHFLDRKYSAFIILTQSCDIVRRENGRCKSRYINLAVVRPLEEVLPSLLETECDPVCIDNRRIDGLYVAEDKARAENLMERVFNQNEHGLGLFYLHPDADVKIAVPSVALLQVSIALRASHYDALVEARSGRLDSVFQSRLGWIVGNLFSRVATRDWPKKEWQKVLADVYSLSQQNGKGPHWIPRKTAEAAQNKGINADGRPIQEVVRDIEKHKPISQRDRAVTRLLEIHKEVFPTAEPRMTALFRQKLINDQTFAAAFKR